MQSQLSDKKLLRRGKVRDVYDEDDQLLIVATDRISAFDVVMPKGIEGKGVALTKLSEFWFLKTAHVFPNHFISKYDDRTLRVKKANRIDIEWIVRAYLYGSAWRAYSKGAREISGVKIPGGLQLAEELPEIIMTPTTKSDVGHDQELSKEEALNRKLVSLDEWNELEEGTYRLFEYYKREARLKGIIIPDFKLEFGRLGKDELIQIDEPPTHDSARFWSMDKYKVGEKQEKNCLDKEFLRDFLLRKGFSGEGEVPDLPEIVLSQISKRCIGAFQVLSGQKTLDSLGLLSVDEVLAQTN
ncbi:MAG: phosphoribosylaminoimidazolesuccinocarboxamide synthase [Thaumarchaeota archaeon]|nr:phosphoribosylaminoimidazolesuccinocarboxamide synthase [Nitrososphaerota archaeon]